MAKFALTLDSSQLTTFFECPQRWNNYYEKKLEPISFKEDENMNAGTYGHKLLDIYYRMRAKGLGLNDSLEHMQAYNPDVDICECGCSKDFHCPLAIAPTIEECKKCNKCTKFRPHPFELNTKDRKKVLKRLNDYVYKYQQNDIVPTSEQHVEIGFSEPIYEDNENYFVLEGRIDILGKLQGLDCFMDHKFQSKTYWLYPRSIQMKNYMLISRTPMGIINYVRLHDKIDKDITLVREPVTMNRVELDAWHKRLVQVFFNIKKIQQASTGKEIERRWNSCSGGKLTYDKNFPNYCWYTSLCEEIDPRMAEAKEKQFFKIKENPWRPW